jgi:hypothetical protein
MQRSALSAALFVRQIRPVLEEAGEGGPALQDVVGEVVVRRELGALRGHPGCEYGNERRDGAHRAAGQRQAR